MVDDTQHIIYLICDGSMLHPYFHVCLIHGVMSKIRHAGRKANFALYNPNPCNARGHSFATQALSSSHNLLTSKPFISRLWAVKLVTNIQIHTNSGQPQHLSTVEIHSLLL